MNKTALKLTKEMKVKLLRAIQLGVINLVEFPELQAAAMSAIEITVSQYSQEEKRILLKLVRVRPLESYSTHDEISVVTLTSEVKHRLLKAMQTGLIDMTDFPELRSKGGSSLRIDLDEFTPEELQILINLSFITQKSITNP